MRTGTDERSASETEVGDGRGAMTETRREVVEWIAATLHELQLTDSTEPLREATGLLGRGIGLDSMEALQLVVAAEDRFDLTIDEGQLKPEYFRTVGAFAAFLEHFQCLSIGL